MKIMSIVLFKQIVKVGNCSKNLFPHSKGLYTLYLTCEELSAVM